MLISRINYGGDCLSACDKNCDKAWGINNRPRIYLDDPSATVYPNKSYRYPEENPAADCSNWDMDNYAFLADSELPEAPKNSNTYEGGQGKPINAKKHNKWCVRECERCKIIELEAFLIGSSELIPSFEERSYNKGESHG